ncbi:hypothetical protein [Azospirillum sp. ST 5-10]|uniref:hypothetical protein n=1 Tax=unclassified Azospirillum TaxID=2630922 RepID=UPI003F4A0744
MTRGGPPPDGGEGPPPDGRKGDADGPDRAAASAETFLAVAMAGGVLALLATAAYLLRLFGWLD